MLIRKTASLTVLLLAAALAAGCQGPCPHRQCCPARDGVFVHISHGAESSHAVLMALKMANLMSADRDVLVYFDVTGVNVVLKDAPDLVSPTFESSGAQLTALLDKGVPLYVCPSCLTAAGKRPEDLRPGVKIAEKDAFFGFTKGRILTLDY